MAPAAHLCRHSFAVRSTHWVFAFAFFLLVFSSLPILIAHPRFYWGETGALGTHPLFVLPLPLWVGRSGWGRSLHFLAGWIAVFAGVFYVASGILTNLFKRRLASIWAELPSTSFRRILADTFHPGRNPARSPACYSLLQRVAYLSVVFLLFPLILLSGLAMSPAITSVTPWLVESFGGHQSARTLHFLFSQLLVLFFIAHVWMVARAGFVARTMAMVVSSPPPRQANPIPASSERMTGGTKDV